MRFLADGRSERSKSNGKLVQKHMEREGADLAELAARMTESLADLILLAPENEQSKLMADALANLGQAFLEKSGMEPEDNGARH